MKTTLTKFQAAHARAAKFNQTELKISAMKMAVIDEFGHQILDLNELTPAEILNLRPEDII